jgi:hypothetical protein
MAEWLRRGARNAMGSARVGSNPTGRDLFSLVTRWDFFFLLLYRIMNQEHEEAQLNDDHELIPIKMKMVVSSTFWIQRKLQAPTSVSSPGLTYQERDWFR